MVTNFQLRQKLSRTNIRQNFSSLQKVNFLDSLLKNIVEALTTDMSKIRFNRLYRERNLLFYGDIDYTNVYALPALVKSRTK